MSIPFDIDSIIQKVYVPVESKKIVSAKRYFSLRKNNLKNNIKIKISRKLLKSGETSPIGNSSRLFQNHNFAKPPVILIDPTLEKSEGCLSPMANAF